MEAQSKTILIIEDEPLQVQALTAALEKEHYTVATAANGREGVDKARATKPDLIVLDLVMPVSDGIAVLKTVNSEDALKQTPILVLTNFALQEEARPYLDPQKDQFFIKTNLTLADVVKKVGSILA